MDFIHGTVKAGGGGGGGGDYGEEKEKGRNYFLVICLPRNCPCREIPLLLQEGD